MSRIGRARSPLRAVWSMIQNLRIGGQGAGLPCCLGSMCTAHEPNLGDLASAAVAAQTRLAKPAQGERTVRGRGRWKIKLKRAERTRARQEGVHFDVAV